VGEGEANYTHTEGEPDFKVGQFSDDLELQEPIAAGQDGEVWVARERRLNRQVAVKILRGLRKTVGRGSSARSRSWLASATRT